MTVKPGFSREEPREGNQVKYRFLVVLIIAFIMAGWLCQAGIGIKKTLLSPSYYHELLEELEVHSHLRDYLVANIYHVGETRDIPLSDSFVNKALEAALNDIWIQQQAERLTDEAFSYVMGRQKQLSVIIDLQDRKEIFKEKLLQELKKLSPPELVLLELTEIEVEDFLDQMNLPDRITLLTIEETDEPGEELDTAISLVRKASFFFTYVPYIVFAGLTLLLLLWAGYSDGIKWIGVSMVASAITYGIMMHGLFMPALKTLTAARFEKLHHQIPGAVGSALDYTKDLILNVTFFYALVGLVLLAAGLIIIKIKER